MTALDDVKCVKQMITAMPVESQTRINIVAGILRDMLVADRDNGEVELAFTLVLSELTHERA